MKPIETMLTEIPLMADEAWSTRGTKVVSSDGPSARTVPGSRCLADLDRMLAASGANDWDGFGVLSGWVRMIRDEMHEAGEPEIDWPSDTWADSCEWLSERLRWCMGRGFESELHEDIRRLHATLRRLTKRNDAAPWPCLTEGCQGSMRLVDGMLECGNGHRHDGLRKWRHHPSMALPELAEALNIPERTLRHWVGRGLIPIDDSKGNHPRHAWPWDVVRRRYPELVAVLEVSAA